MCNLPNKWRFGTFLLRLHISKDNCVKLLISLVRETHSGQWATWGDVWSQRFGRSSVSDSGRTPFLRGLLMGKHDYIVHLRSLHLLLIEINCVACPRVIWTVFEKSFNLVGNNAVIEWTGLGTGSWGTPLRTGLGTGPVTGPGGTPLPMNGQTPVKTLLCRILWNAVVINMILYTTLPMFVDFFKSRYARGGRSVKPLE